jgi:hypothetical protein
VQGLEVAGVDEVLGTQEVSCGRDEGHVSPVSRLP